jgi:hypothetical protein
MAERRKVRSGTGSRARARSREPAERDEQEMLDEEPAAADEDELVDADEPEEPDDETLYADEPEAADEDEPSGNGRRRPARRSRSAMTAGEAAKAALREIAQLTAKEPEGVTGVERTEDGWTVGIELVEDQRIPSSADILATYEATIDAEGELVSYRRVRRYARGRADAEEL